MAGKGGPFFAGHHHSAQTRSRMSASHFGVKTGRTVSGEHRMAIIQGTRIYWQQTRPVDIRFDEKISPEPMSGCFLWTAAIDENTGYGKFWNPLKGCVEGAHVFAYERINGPVPTGLELDHLCATKICVNPNHLEAVTHTVNAQRRDLRKRRM